MNKLAATLFSILILGCSKPTINIPRASIPTPPPKLGDSYTIENTFDQLAITCNSFRPYTEITINEIKYTIAVNSENKIVFIETRDPKFVTPEGLSVGANLDLVLKSGGEPPWDEFGWGYHSLLPSGWHADFGSTLFDAALINPQTAKSTYRFFIRE
jgi:hypothetical protein